jgi:hypothetical protein
MKRFVVAAVLVGALGAGWLVRQHARTAAPREERSSAAEVAQSPAMTGGAGKAEAGTPPRSSTHMVRGPEGVNAPLSQAEANARSVVEAAQSGEHPERLNALVPARPFDRAAFEADPQGYLNVVEPGRVWQTADGAEGVKTLAAVGVAYKEVDPGGSVLLEVEGEAGAPVTFTSLDMGAFENKLASITVRAGGDGVARAVFTATSGTVNMVNILAGSPLAVGQAKFVVRVTEG